MGDMIKLEGVFKEFDGKPILQGVNFIVSKGEIFGVLGESGSGKSVILKILMGFIKPDEGEVVINSKVGFSMQNNSLYENLTLIQNLNYFSNMYGVTNKKEKIKNLLKILSLEGYEKTLVANLSGGTKKRGDIACALLNDPEILILDEPFVGLDSFLVQKLSRLIVELRNQGMTIILSSHLMSQVENLCTKTIFIKNKKVYSVDKSQLKSLYSNGF